jgi:hypothetical protein
MIPPVDPAPSREELSAADLIRKPEFVRKPDLKIRSDAEILILSQASGLVVFLGALVIQWIIYDRFLHQDGLRLVGSVIAGGFGALLVHVMNLQTRRSRLSELRRLEDIALLNHHIRNALQAIVCCSGSSESAEIIHESVDRIERVLYDVLGRIEREPKAPETPTAE